VTTIPLDEVAPAASAGALRRPIPRAVPLPDGRSVRIRPVRPTRRPCELAGRMGSGAGARALVFDGGRLAGHSAPAGGAPGPSRRPGYRLSTIGMRTALHDVHLDGPADRCRRILLESPLEWLPRAEAAGDRHFVAWVGFGDGLRVDKEVELTIGLPASAADRLVVPISWRATGPHGLFPIFHGAFRLRPLRPHVCRLSLTGSYEPPLGELGRRLDEAGLRRVAEATVRDLAEAVAARVSHLAAGRPLAADIRLRAAPSRV